MDESLDAGDVSRAWLVLVRLKLRKESKTEQRWTHPWQRFGLWQEECYVSGCQAWWSQARGNAADAVDAADIFLYRDSSIAPLLHMRRRFKAVMNVLGAMIQYGVSLARSVELTALGQDSCCWSFVSCHS